MRRHPRWGIAVLGVSAIAISIAVGVEPDGHIVWDLSSADAGERTPDVKVRVRLEAVAPLRQVRLRVAGPEGVFVLSEPVPGLGGGRLPEQAADGVFLLGDLDRGRPLLLQFEFALPPGTGGLAAFTLSGILADGRPVEESVGWTLAAPRGPPRRRFGAAEYPAVLQPGGAR